MRFFKDHAEADEVCYRLDNLGVKNCQVCACIRDRKQLQCENFMSYCPNGVYVEVPEMYASALDTLAHIAKYDGKEASVPIMSFRGDYACFSNFHDARMTVNGVLWRTVEHAFQANKTFNKEWQNKILSAITAKEAKALGKQLKTLGLLRPDWREVSVLIMHHLVLLKFTFFTEYRNVLLSTGDDPIVESNWWHDNFWGECSCERCSNIEKFNHLGLILVRVRKMLRINAVLNG